MCVISAECLHTLTEAFAVCHPTHMWQLLKTYAGTAIARTDGSVFGIWFEWFTGRLCWLSLPWPGFFTTVLELILHYAGACTQEALKICLLQGSCKASETIKSPTRHTGSQPSLDSSCSNIEIRSKQAFAVLVLQVCSWRCGSMHTNPVVCAQMPDVLTMHWEFWSVAAHFPLDWLLLSSHHSQL